MVVGWLRTGLIVIAALALMGYAAARSLSNAVVDQNPGLAASLAPANGLAQDQLVRLQFAPLLQKPGGGNLEPVIARARVALQQEPFALSSLAAIVAYERNQHRPAVANAVLDHAARLSRRDVLVQLELIQRASTTGDERGLIRHMDEALRTNQALYGTLFPVLAQALNHPRLIDLMAPIAREDPSWYRLFIGEALTIPAALPGVRQLMLMAPNGSAARDPQLRINLINQLIANNQIGLARAYFQALHPQMHGPILDPDFTHPSLEAPFGWLVNEDPDLTADFVRGEGLTAYAASDREGVVARQLVSFPPGTYTIRLDADAADLSVIYLAMACHGSNDELPVAANRGKGTFQFRVPTNCSNQWLELGLRDGDDSRPIEASVRSLTLR